MTWTSNDSIFRAKPLDCKVLKDEVSPLPLVEHLEEPRDDERDTIDREQSYRLVFFISSFCFRCIISSRCYSLAIKLVRIRTIYALSKKESC